MSNLERSRALRNMFESWVMRTRRGVSYKMAGDMPERLQWLVDKFAGIGHIVEFGSSSGCSSAAWLACAGKSYVTVDISKHPALDVNAMQRIADELGIWFEFLETDDMGLPPVECDLLCIDTTHREQETYLELKRHSSGVEKYIVMHDSNPEFTGVDAGVRRWLDEMGEGVWEIVYNEYAPPVEPATDMSNAPWYRDCGLMVIERLKK